MNIGVQDFVWTYAFVLLDKYTRAGLLGCVKGVCI